MSVPETITETRGGNMTTEQDRTTPLIGDILCCSWGYDQTNIDYYEVVGLTPSGKSVRLQPVGYDRCDGTTWGAYTVTPAPGNYTGPVFTKRWRPNEWNGKGYSVTMNSYSSASLDDGAPHHMSTYA